MLSINTANLNPGWFTGTSGETRQYIGPNGYFSTEGFPREAYSVPPSWMTSPETIIAQQILAEDVRGNFPVENTQTMSRPPVEKMVASMAVATQVSGLGAVPAANSSVPYLPIVFWLARVLGISTTAVGSIGIFASVLGLFEYGRIFVFWKGEAIGAMIPELALTWYYELDGNQQRHVRMRMEAADKGGWSSALPLGSRGYSPDESGESPWDKINPFEPGSFWDRINPFI